MPGYNICSATGTTTAPNEDITALCKQVTKYHSDTSAVFRMTKINIFCDTNTDIYINTSDTFISDGKNAVKTKESFSGSGEYVIGTNLDEVSASRIVIGTSGTTWTITFLY